MCPGNDGQFGENERKKLSNTYGFLKGLCDQSSEGFSQLKMKLDRAPEGSGLPPGERTTFYCPPILPPRNGPVISGDQCRPRKWEEYDPIFGEHVSMGDLEKLFQHMAEICRLIQEEFGEPGAPTS